MKYPVDQIMKVKERLSQLPKVALADKESVTANEAIALMSDVLKSLQEKGYTMDMLAKLLNEQGLGISLSTLRRYLRQANAEGPRLRRKKKVRNEAVPRTQPPEPSTVPVPPRPAAVQKARGTSPAATQRETKKSTAFAVREDTDDI